MFAFVVRSLPYAELRGFAQGWKKFVVLVYLLWRRGFADRVDPRGGRRYNRTFATAAVLKVIALNVEREKQISGDDNMRSDRHGSPLSPPRCSTLIAHARAIPTRVNKQKPAETPATDRASCTLQDLSPGGSTHSQTSTRTQDGKPSLAATVSLRASQRAGKKHLLLCAGSTRDVHSHEGCA